MLYWRKATPWSLGMKTPSAGILLSVLRVGKRAVAIQKVIARQMEWGEDREISLYLYRDGDYWVREILRP